MITYFLKKYFKTLMHITVQIKFNILSIKLLIWGLTPRRNELGGAVLPISVRKSVHVSVYGIIASPIRRHHHTSIYFSVFDKMVFHFYI